MKQTALRHFSTQGPRLFGEVLNPQLRPIFDKLGLGVPSELRMIAVPKLKVFPVQISTAKKHTFSQQHWKYFGSPEHALTDKFLSHYADRPFQPLYIYSVAAAHLEDSKAVVRNRARTRVRRAFCVALTDNGYNWLGVGISNKHNTKGTELLGTVRLRTLSPKKILLLEFPDLVSYFAELVKSSIVPELSRRTEKDSTEMPEGSLSQDIDENTEAPEEVPLSGPDDKI